MSGQPHDHAEATALETARDLLDRNREGTLLVDSRPFQIRFIADPATGELIAPVPREAAETTDTILFVPEESFDAIQLMVTVTRIEESSVTDRWCAYHLEPRHPAWARLAIDSGKHGTWVFPGEALSGPNPLAGQESALCRVLNEDKSALGGIVRRASGVEAPEPVCVGVIGRGVYVRCRFSVVLARFEEPAGGGDAARAQIDRWLADADARR